jgi:hypothetical protein
LRRLSNNSIPKGLQVRALPGANQVPEPIVRKFRISV